MKDLLKKILTYIVFSISFISADTNFYDLVDQNKSLIDNLDYYKSKEVAFNFPNGKQLVLNWGDVGHGDLLQPFNGITPQISSIDVLTDNSDQEFSVKNVAKKMGKLFVKNKIKSFIGKDLDLFLEKLPPAARWIVEKIVKNGKLNPFEEFVLRSFILYKTPFDADKQALKQAEFIALLFKLAITQGQDILNVKKDFGQYIAKNEMLNELFGKGFVSFATDTLFFIQKDTSYSNLENVAKKSVSTIKLAYLFKDADLAKQCFDKFLVTEQYPLKAFKGIAEGFIKNLVVDSQDIWSVKNYEIVSFEQFVEYKNSSFGNFVGIKQNFDNELLADIKPGVCLFSDENGYWVAFKSQKDEFDFYETSKFAIAAISQAFKDYTIIKNRSVISNSPFLGYVKPVDHISVIESKEKLNNLLQAKEYIKGELSVIDIEIKEVNKKLDSSLNSFWNKHFTNSYQENLKDLKDRKARKEKQLLSIEQEIKKMNIGLYYFSASEHLQDLSDKGVIAISADMFLSNPKIQEFIQNINQNPEYKSVKNDLIKRLAAIFGKSDYVKEYWEIAQYVLSNLLPDYKNDFTNFAKNLNQQGDSGTAELLLSFVGL
ncbi:MAG: hypothetical protein ABIF12_01095 [bacterium]